MCGESATSDRFPAKPLLSTFSGLYLQLAFGPPQVPAGKCLPRPPSFAFFASPFVPLAVGDNFIGQERSSGSATPASDRPRLTHSDFAAREKKREESFFSSSLYSSTTNQLQLGNKLEPSLPVNYVPSLTAPGAIILRPGLR